MGYQLHCAGIRSLKPNIRGFVISMDDKRSGITCSIPDLDYNQVTIAGMSAVVAAEPWRDLL